MKTSSAWFELSCAAANGSHPGAIVCGVPLPQSAGLLPEPRQTSTCHFVQSAGDALASVPAFMCPQAKMKAMPAAAPATKSIDGLMRWVPFQDFIPSEVWISGLRVLHISRRIGLTPAS
jgi:hypothetical protein